MSVKLIDPTIDPRWDEFVESHPCGLICHHSKWKKVLETGFKHLEGYYFVLVDKDNHIQAGLPVYKVKSWVIGNRIVSIPFATLSDPLIENCDQFQSLFEAVKTHFMTNNNFLEIKSFLTSPLLKNMNNMGASSSFKHHYLRLDKDIDLIKRSFHKKSVRSALSKAERSPVELRRAENCTDLKQFYHLYVITRKKLSLPPQPFAFFKAIWNSFFPDNFQIIQLFHRNKAIAALAFFKYKDRVSTEFAGWDTAYSEFKPNHLLYWEGIKAAHRENYSIFDFGRTNIQNKGLSDFKSRWGTQSDDLFQFYYPKDVVNNLPNDEDSWKYKIVQNICRFSPLPITPLFGNFCYRHLG